MEELTSNVCETEEVSSSNESLDEETRAKLAIFPLPKVSNTRKYIVSNCVEQVTLLKNAGLRRLKKDPEAKENCCNHARIHCDALLRALLEVSASKKSESGGRHHTVDTQRHLGNICADEGCASSFPSLQGRERQGLKV